MELIDREEVLNILNDICNRGAIERIDRLPTIESRPKAKWIVDRYCSSCEWDKHDFEYIGGWRENYCPCCGADMRGE